MPYEIESVFGGFTATAAPAPQPTLVAEAVPEIQTDVRTGADSADTDPAMKQADRSPIESEEETSEVEADEEETTARAPRAPRDDRYQFSMQFIWGIERPLMQLVDTETQETVYSYPAERRARMFAEADALTIKDFDAAAIHTVDASA